MLTRQTFHRLVKFFLAYFNSSFRTACTIAPPSPLSRPSNVFICSCPSSKPKTSAFSSMRDGVSLLGSGTHPLSKQYRMST